MPKKGKNNNNESNATSWEGPEANVSKVKSTESINPSKEGIEYVCKDVSGAVNRLKNEYPTDPKLVAGILGAITLDKKIPEFVQMKIFEIIPQVMKRLLDDNKPAQTIIYLLTIIANLTAYDNKAFRVQACTDSLLKFLSDMYKLITSSNHSYDKSDVKMFQKMGCGVLANITVADETVPKILKTPHLFALGSNEMLVVENRQAASLFLMNCSYEELGRELMTNGKIEIYEALVSYIATLNNYDTLEQCYLSISNSFTIRSVEKRNTILKALVNRKFFETSVPRDVKRGYEFALGLLVNVGQEDLDHYMVINKELMEALVFCATQPKTSDESIDLIGGILHHFTVNEKKVSAKLAEVGAGPLLKQLAQQTRDSTIKEYASILATRVGVLKGDVDTVHQKCSNPGCISRSKNMKKCSGCGAAWYCSKDCQISHWKKGHRASCNKLKQQVEEDGKVNKNQADIDRTVAMNFLKENENNFKAEAKKRKLRLSECVVMVDITTLAKCKSAIYAIPEYYESILPRQPFAEKMDMGRLRESHANSQKGCAFIAIVIQAVTVNAFVVPMEEPDIKVNWKALLRGDDHEDEWLDEIENKRIEGRKEEEEEEEEDYDDEDPAPGLVARFLGMLGLD